MNRRREWILQLDDRRGTCCRRRRPVAPFYWRHTLWKKLISLVTASLSWPRVASNAAVTIWENYKSEIRVREPRILTRFAVPGSSLFLKKKFGMGYHLVIVKEEQCNVDRITETIRKYIPGVKVNQNVGAELSYLLPSNQSHQFQYIFQELEMNRKSYGMSSYGASVTTMEEVFLIMVRSFNSVQRWLWTNRWKGFDLHVQSPCLFHPHW